MTLFFYVFGVFYVVPKFFGIFGQTVYFLVGTAIAYNIFGNLIACYKTVSSVDTLPPEMMVPQEGEEHLWHFCEVCQKTVPPRSWHCKVCRVCILKRDHHCNFVGNCVGYNNQRYFMWFSFWAAFGSGLAFYHNIKYANRNDIYFLDMLSMNVVLYYEFMKPGTYDLGLQFGVRFVLGFNLFAIAFPAFLFLTQIYTIRRNAVMHNTSDRTYDLGIYRNFSEVLGRRRFWTFLSPNIKSPLPHNGTQWTSKRIV
ncbi:probable palmitoyltransferase ZDHHC24 [Drosophila eugracilis]|uniref:probable palmitoyltransferase ZDHHC24 n=1 Tax=Drosophila eugracilis TaxID=29029 RepID=UPI001BD91F37|nr:probable palmitoyltransferase ZDHHC24 [Drosophila eugracilis]